MVIERIHMNAIPEIKTILYTTALGEHTRPVFRYAISLARHYNAEIVIVHVVEPLSNTAKAVIKAYLSAEDVEKIQNDDIREVLQEIKSRLDQFCKEELASHDSSDSQVRDILVVEGDPGEEILRVAEKYTADLIVIGKSTGPVFGNTVMGTVARRVTRLAAVPVVVVPNN
jgi:nucleotide-binding universal stress UspA family protein